MNKHDKAILEIMEALGTANEAIVAEMRRENKRREEHDAAMIAIIKALGTLTVEVIEELEKE